MSGGFFTVGHSNRGKAEFIDMLRQARIGMIADVRRFPRSRSNPAFNIDTLPADLERHQIGYRHFPDLGGRRNLQHDIPDDLNAFWRVRSFHNYADYALTEPFAMAFSDLVEAGRGQSVAIMCSEAVWWRCHRRIIADHLMLAGHEVTHLMGEGRQDVATPTVAATRRADGAVVYPASEPA